MRGRPFRERAFAALFSLMGEILIELIGLFVGEVLVDHLGHCLTHNGGMFALEDIAAHTSGLSVLSNNQEKRSGFRADRSIMVKGSLSR